MPTRFDIRALAGTADRAATAAACIPGALLLLTRP
jgi:hypothetical protein